MLSNLSLNQQSQSDIADAGDIFEYKTNNDIIENELDEAETDLVENKDFLETIEKEEVIIESVDETTDSNILNNILMDSINNINLGAIPNDSDDNINITLNGGFLKSIN